MWYPRRLKTLLLSCTAATLAPNVINVANPAARNAAAPSAATAGPVRAGAGKPDVFLLLIDTLRADRLGCYGDPRLLAPTVDAIAASGVVFESALAPAPWTRPSMASLFTAVDPGVHRVLMFPVHRQSKSVREGREPSLVALDDGYVTLAEHLREHGYRTAAFVANPLLWDGSGNEQGFDHYHDDGASNNNHSGEALNRAAVAWLRKPHRVEQPAFVYLHYMDVHGPYRARKELLEPLLGKVAKMPDKRRLSDDERAALHYLVKAPAARDYPKLTWYLEFWSALYDAGVRQMDENLADFVKSLQAMDRWDDSVVVVVSDHGEELLEHGYWDHGDSLYHTVLHVPLIVRWPGLLKPRRISGVTSVTDLAPTLVDLLELPPMPAVQGRSLASRMRGEAAGEGPGSLPAFPEGLKGRPGYTAVYAGDWKATLDPWSNARLYNLARDPGERRDLSGDHPDKLSQLLELIREHTAANRELMLVRLAAEAEGEPVVPAEHHERLRALGYVQ